MFFYIFLPVLQRRLPRRDISTIYRQGFAKFVQGVLTRTPPEPYGTLLRPVQILNALVEAAQTGREAFVAPPLE